MRNVGFCLRMPALEADNSNWNLHRQTWEGLHKAGIHYIAITARMPSNNPVSSGKPVAVQKEWLREFDFRLNSVHYHGPCYARLDDGEGQKYVQSKLAEFVKLYRELEPYAIVLHAGCVLGASSNLEVFNAFHESCRNHGNEKTLQVLAENIAGMADAAAKYNIKIALENMGRLLPVGDRDSLGRLIALADRSNVGYCVDSGHAHCCGESVVEWLEIAGERLFETHFHDNHAKAAHIPDVFVVAEGVDEHLFPGLGTIDWREVIDKLDVAGYARPVMFECPGLPASNLADGYKKAVAWWCQKVEKGAVRKSW